MITALIVIKNMIGPLRICVIGSKRISLGRKQNDRDFVERQIYSYRGWLLITERLDTKRNFRTCQQKGRLRCDFNANMTDFSCFLTVMGLDQYYESFSLERVVSLTTLFAMTHEQLNELAIEMNMPGDDLSQLQIQIFCHKNGRSWTGPLSLNYPKHDLNQVIMVFIIRFEY